MDFSNIPEITNTIVSSMGGKTAVLAIAYGLASDLIGQMPIKQNSVPALIWAFIRGGVETVLKIKGRVAGQVMQKPKDEQAGH